MVHHFNGGQKIILHSKDIDSLYNFTTQEIENRVDEFVKQESGWIYMNTEKIELNVYTGRYLDQIYLRPHKLIYNASTERFFNIIEIF